MKTAGQLADHAFPGSAFSISRRSRWGKRRQAALAAATDALKRQYAAHIEREETVVFRRAARTLKAAAIAVMGREFRARRA
jgi:hypothetical protein